MKPVEGPIEERLSKRNCQHCKQRKILVSYLDLQSRTAAYLACESCDGADEWTMTKQD